jgi:hypothetical protein
MGEPFKKVPPSYFFFVHDLLNSGNVQFELKKKEFVKPVPAHAFGAREGYVLARATREPGLF